MAHLRTYFVLLLCTPLAASAMISGNDAGQCRIDATQTACAPGEPPPPKLPAPKRRLREKVKAPRRLDASSSRAPRPRPLPERADE